MGINFDGLFNAASSAIRSAASMQENTSKVDTTAEKESLKNIFLGINKTAKNNISSNVDKVHFENLVAQEKSEVTPFVDDAEILADLMGALAEVNPEMDMKKIDEYNKKYPQLSADKDMAETIMNGTDDGYVGLDPESMETIADALGENAGKVFHYMSDAIQMGSGSRISNDVAMFQRDNEGASRIIDALHNNDDTRADYMA